MARGALLRSFLAATQGWDTSSMGSSIGSSNLGGCGDFGGNGGSGAVSSTAPPLADSPLLARPVPAARKSPSAFSVLSLSGPKKQRRPPIDCSSRAAQKEEDLDTLELRAAGERAQGRKTDSPEGSPAEEKLEKRLAEEAARKKAEKSGTASKKAKAADAAKKNKMARRAKAKAEEELDPKAGMKSHTIIQTPFKMEMVWSPKRPIVKKPKHKVKRKLPTLHLPKLPSRHEIINEGPYPIEQRLAALAAHAYYLWGDSKFIVELAGGTQSELLAKNLERFAKAADKEGRAMVQAAHIPLSKAPPNLPLEVSVAPPPVMVAAAASLATSTEALDLQACRPCAQALPHSSSFHVDARGVHVHATACISCPPERTDSVT